MSKFSIQQQLSTLSEGDSEPPEEPYAQNIISAKGPLPSAGGTEVLLGDQSLRQDNRYIYILQIIYFGQKQKTT